MIDIITAESSSRPDGSPPTYDDAMKYVNDAFENSDTEVTNYDSSTSINSQLYRQQNLLQHIHQL